MLYVSKMQKGPLRRSSLVPHQDPALLCSQRALVLNFFATRPSTLKTLKLELTSIMLKGGKIN